jgi:hypothetical protein
MCKQLHVHEGHLWFMLCIAVQVCCMRSKAEIAPHRAASAGHLACYEWSPQSHHLSGSPALQEQPVQYTRHRSRPSVQIDTAQARNGSSDMIEGSVHEAK